MDNKLISQWAKQSNLTDLEPEEYILTKEEENTILSNEVLSLMRHYSWKMKGLGYTDQQITEKIKPEDCLKELNRDLILQQANSNKHYSIWEKEQRVKEKQEAVDKFKRLQEKCTAKYMFRLMQSVSQNEFNTRLIVNENNKNLITTLCYFLSNDKRFESELEYSFQKGLLIRGISGLGKTHLVKCLQRNELNPILILSMVEIAEEVKFEGEYQINLGENKIIYLDDVGTEEATVNHFGTKINFFKNFIELVYLKNQNKTFNKLMISTNNSFSEIEEKYGFRVRSRMKEMFNIVDVTGEDMRG